MAEASSHLESQPTSSTPDNTRNNDAEPAALQYWCYHCEKRVSIETLAADLPDIICFECKNGFVESVCPPPPAAAAPTQSEPPPPPPPDNTSNNNEDPSFSNQFLQILRLIAEAARDDGDPPPPPPQPAVSDPGDFLRIELNGWNNDDEEDGDDDGIDVDPSSDNETANNNDDDEDDEEVVRQRRRELLRSRIRDFASRATRNRILDWSEILMGLEDHTMEFRVGGAGGYVGNPEDYVDAAGYEALLQNLADADAGARRGPPPASKSAISNLNTLNINYQDESTVCAICKDSFSVPLTAKMLPCGHGYHEDCIVTWLGSRNTCPVCRFELPTDDPEYEQQRLKSSAATSSSNFTSSSNQ